MTRTPEETERAVRAAVAASEPPDSVVLPAIPRYPLAELAGPLGEFVGWAQRDGLHAEAAVAAGLAALATLTGPARLSLTPVRHVRGILWIALVGVASSGKSPAIEHAFARTRERYAIAREHYEVLREAWEAGAGDEPPMPQPYELDDATTEAVARWLIARRAGGGDGEPSGAVIDDELAATLLGLNQYRGGQGADRARWLKLWTGADLHVMRVGRGGARNEVDLYVREPVVSLAGPLTPDSLHLLGSQGSGFRPRWLPHLVPSQQPAWTPAGGHPQNWTSVIDALHDGRKPRTWELSTQARREWEDARQRWEDQQREPEPDDVIEALRKADIQAARIALVLAESLAPGSDGEVPAEAMRCAITHMDYVIGCWRALPGSDTMAASRADDVMDAMSGRLLAWLESRPRGSEGLPDGSPPRPRATRREIQQWSHLKATRVTALILEHGQRYPGCVVVVEPHGGGLPRQFVYAPERGAIAVTATAKHSVPPRRAKPSAQVSDADNAPDPVLRPATPNPRNTESATPKAPCRHCGPESPVHRPTSTLRGKRVVCGACGRSFIGGKP